MTHCTAVVGLGELFSLLLVLLISPIVLDTSMEEECLMSAPEMVEAHTKQPPHWGCGESLQRDPA